MLMCMSQLTVVSAYKINTCYLKMFVLIPFNVEVECLVLNSVKMISSN